MPRPQTPGSDPKSPGLIPNPSLDPKLPSLDPKSPFLPPNSLPLPQTPVSPPNPRFTPISPFLTPQPATFPNFPISPPKSRRHTLSRRRIIPLPQWKANPETDPEALFQKEQLVLALYPQTTCFYRALIHAPPQRVRAQIRLFSPQNVCRPSAGVLLCGEGAGAGAVRAGGCPPGNGGGWGVLWGLYGALWVFTGRYGTLWVPVGSLGPYGVPHGVPLEQAVFSLSTL